MSNTKNSLLKLLLLSLIALPSGGQHQANPSNRNQASSKTNNQQPTITVFKDNHTAEKDKQPPESHNKNRNLFNADNGTWALVIVGFLGTLAAVFTLCAIKQQVIEMRKAGQQTRQLIRQARKQSEAAAKSASALVHSERAFLDVELTLLPRGFNCYAIKVTNHGRTLGKITSYSFGFKCFPPHSAIITTLQPDEQLPFVKVNRLVIPKGIELLEESPSIFLDDYFGDDWKDVSGGIKTGAVFASVAYEDMVGDAHITSVVYTYSHNRNVLIDRKEYRTYE